MKRFLAILVSSILVTSCSPNYQVALTSNTTNTKINVSQSKVNLLFKLKNDFSEKKINSIISEFGLSNINYISKELNLAEVSLNNVDNAEKIKQAFIKNNLVDYAEKDAKLKIFDYKAYPSDQVFETKAATATPNDTFFPLQWNMGSIGATKAWTITTGSSDVTVAVIDSGVDPDHPDLQDNLLPLIDVLAESGEVDVYSFGNNSVDYTGKDGNGHGTHVTGVIGALINNAKGVAGLAGNVKILPIKAANFDGSTSASIITKSIIKAIENNVRVINLSIGGPKSEGTQALKDAVDLAISKGIVFISATGNESARATGFIEAVTVPAAYPNVIAVSAVTERDKVANYSNGGPEVEIAAPGGGGLATEGKKIYSTWPTYVTFEGYRAGIRGPYAYLSGTSMSCPHVSAAAALLFSRYPNMTGQQVRVRLLSTAKEIGQNGFDSNVGYGKLDVYDALTESSHDKKVN